MRKEIIKTDNYLLLVSDEKIKRKDYVLTDNSTDPLYLDGSTNTMNMLLDEGWIKIIAHLPLNSPELEGVALLPEIEVPLPKFEADAMDAYIRERHTQEECTGFIDGYEKAKEVYKFTEEDLRKAIYIAWEDDDLSSTDIIQSLQQPKYPIAFECKMVKTPSPIFYFRDVPYSSPKTITNSQGKTELIGTYIWE